ncbi:winged helix-turn-helix domain-containing protein [Jongsikchunia kroppenstedtii]|uniref:winged helix-turn-helix domain-containing protein n=1 Tax=Jongsikchunia kroppenstedtii TaxID=1121721 RepID=UPI00036DB058|nr:crosslink repair DNA glycosylase YcaQ family protein [Jongsikchunia kroppenstedtii]
MGKLVGPELSLPQARRLALAAQGFADRVPSTPTRTHLKRLVGRTQLLQMDSVSVAVRAHYMPGYSRLGAYDQRILERAAWEPTARSPQLLVEYWAHEAALIPMADWPLFRWRMREYRHGRWSRQPDDPGRAALRAEVAAAVADRGPSTSGQIEDVLGHVSNRQKGAWWNRSEVKHVCEAMFAAGELSAIRRGGFTRYYDLAENIVPAELFELEVSERDSVRRLVANSVRALGVGTEADIRDYYRLSIAQTRSALADLVGARVVERVRVAGWTQQAYRDPSITLPRTIARSALLSPFDPVVFFRPRALRLFDFHYRIEIYVPEAKRVHGYYVFPYLLGDRLVARVDIKIDRAADTLWARGVFAEPGVDQAAVAQSLAADLAELARWQGVSRVRVGTRGDLAPLLQQAVLQ